MFTKGLAPCLAHSQPTGNVIAQLVAGPEVSVRDSLMRKRLERVGSDRR